MERFTVAQVYIMDAPYHIDRLYDYYIPADMRGGMISEGGFCVVPFGGGNRKSRALVYRLAEKSEFGALKPILKVLDDAVKLSPEMVKLALFLKSHTFCTVGDAVKAIVPSAAMSKVQVIFRASKDSFEREQTVKLSRNQSLVYSYVKSMGQATVDGVTKDIGAELAPALRELEAMGLLECEIKAAGASNKKYIERVTLAVPQDEAALLGSGGGAVRGQKQKELLKYLAECPQSTVRELEAMGFARAQINALAEKGLLSLQKEDEFRDPYKAVGEKPSRDPGKSPLSDAQRAAKEKILELTRCDEPKAALLHGITGSGKTRVIISVTDEVIAAGKSAIVLIPEISLTPQTVGIFKSRYGDKVAVIHSQLSAGEKFDSWRRMRSGEVRVCVGTRSAIFAPLDNIGLIVIDEEQEHTYKSDMNPKYHARDIASFRCGYHNATMLLASATPSFESYYKALSGTYTLIELNERYGQAKLPSVRVADLRADAAQGDVSALGHELKEMLAQTLERKEQAILFLNRRGYNHFLSCVMCGHVITCPHCSVSLTYHTVGGSGGVMYCHYCGYRAPVPKTCPECGASPLRYVGYGTQKVEEELRAAFPSATVMRMDADTTSGKFSYDRMLSEFREGAADILLGTQMVTKGHDFPNVTLVGVISADSALYLDDFRANEHTFSTLTQVIGRAGRSQKPGYALIQTYNPEHPVIKLSCDQDYAANYKNEMALRRALVFPPFCDVILITLSGQSESELMRASTAFSARLKELLGTEFTDTPMTVFGPMEAPLYKINEIYRMRMVLKCRANARARHLVSTLLCEFEKKTKNKITVSADVNSNNL